MSQFAETELILSSENRVYHINLRSEDIADDVIVVGDQFNTRIWRPGYISSKSGHFIETSITLPTIDNPWFNF